MRLTAFFSFFLDWNAFNCGWLAKVKMLHNILRQNAVNCVLKRRLTAVGPFSRNKSHICILIFYKQVSLPQMYCPQLFMAFVLYMFTSLHLLDKKKIFFSFFFYLLYPLVSLIVIFHMVPYHFSHIYGNWRSGEVSWPFSMKLADPLNTMIIKSVISKTEDDFFMKLRFKDYIFRSFHHSGGNL